MAHQLDQLQKQRHTALQDAAGKLPAGDRDALLQQAILQRYSKDRPQILVNDVPGQGTSFIALPTSTGSAFEDGFSSVQSLEHPIGIVPPSLLLDEEWQMYRAPSGLQIL